MSIAPPRESSMPPNRRLPHINTPTGSARPSIDSPRLQGLQSLQAPSRSDSVSPNRALPPRRNRAALREYYNLQDPTSSKPDDADDASSQFSINDHSLSDVIESELDSSNFRADEFVAKVLKEQSLGEVLKTYNSILFEIRGLDAEKKALVYDNYSKLIRATETIGRMRENMGKGNSGAMAGTLDPAIADIYRRAAAIKEDLKGSLGLEEQREAELGGEERRAVRRGRREREAARGVLEMPGRIRGMVREGRREQARKEWAPVRKVLESWKAKGKGGGDVQRCIVDGDAALRGEDEV